MKATTSYGYRIEAGRRVRPVTVFDLLPSDDSARCWAIAAPNKRPYTVDAAGKYVPASVTDPDTWLTLGQVQEAIARARRLGIPQADQLRAGFMLNDRYPLVCIDLDWPSDQAAQTMGFDKLAELASTFSYVLQRFGGLAELSVSGRGAHVWLVADKRSAGFATRAGGGIGGIQWAHGGVYARERFIVCTGDTIDPYGDGEAALPWSWASKRVAETCWGPWHARGQNPVRMDQAVKGGWHMGSWPVRLPAAVRTPRTVQAFRAMRTAERDEEIKRFCAWVKRTYVGNNVSVEHSVANDIYTNWTGPNVGLKDDDVMGRAWYANNAEKFRALWKGHWSEMGVYPSQSEADSALMSILAFYSDDNAQVLRLFRRSALGKRDKAQRGQYCERTLRHIRVQQHEHRSLMKTVNEKSSAFLQSLQSKATAQAATPSVPTHSAGVPVTASAVPATEPSSIEKVDTLITASGRAIGTRAVHPGLGFDVASLPPVHSAPSTVAEETIARVSQAVATGDRDALTSIESTPVALQVDLAEGEPDRLDSLVESDQGSPSQNRVVSSTVTIGGTPVESYDFLKIAAPVTFPKGVVGDIARFIYRSSIRPVPEMSLAPAIALMAGLCGKAYNVSETGLNNYIVVVGKSGTGKEALHTGIALINKAVTREFPGFGRFIDNARYASGPALRKAVANNNSFVNLNSEFGRQMKRMSGNEPDGPAMTLRTELTELYSKSGEGSMLGGMGYSNKEESFSVNVPVAYSMIGETTPGTFYESLTDSMMEDGFMSRFLIIEYHGDRVPENPRVVTQVPPALVERLGQLSVKADLNNTTGVVTKVGWTEGVQVLQSSFNRYCDDRIIGTTNELWRQVWNRAALKVIRLAALLAVGDNFDTPVITEEQYLWALSVVMNDVKAMIGRIESGEIGSGDTARALRVGKFLRSYFASRSVDPDADPLRADGCVTRKAIYEAIARVPSFARYRYGTNKALDATLSSMIDSGYLVELSRMELTTKYGFSGKAYRVIDLPEEHM